MPFAGRRIDTRSIRPPPSVLFVVMFRNMTLCVLIGCSNILCCHESKVAVMWLEFLPYVRDVLVSNPDTDNTDRVFVDVFNT